jgi:histidinol dehydrogenase
VALILLCLQNSEAMVSTDMPAGPSEVLLIADKYANPVYIAADLLSQVLIFIYACILLRTAGLCRGHVLPE